MQDPKSFPCERCETEASYFYCQECRVVLCDICFNEVHKGKYSLHKYACITNYNYEENVCKMHHLPIEYFCTEEWKGICLECFDMHEEHPVLNIYEAAVQTLFEVKNKKIHLQKIQEQVKYEVDELELTKAEIERKNGDMIEITKDTFSQLKKLLNLKETETISYIENIKEKKISDITIIKKNLQKK